MRRKFSITLYLFGPPTWELGIEDGRRVTYKTCDEIEHLAHDLCERLLKVALYSRKLLKLGWRGKYYGYFITFVKETSWRRAIEELRYAGLNDIIIREGD